MKYNLINIKNEKYKGDYITRIYIDLIDTSLNNKVSKNIL